MRFLFVLVGVRRRVVADALSDRRNAHAASTHRKERRHARALAACKPRRRSANTLSVLQKMQRSATGADEIRRASHAQKKARREPGRASLTEEDKQSRKAFSCAATDPGENRRRRARG
jgi:hypothetical protein